jgi:hypothetical protein
VHRLAAARGAERLRREKAAMGIPETAPQVRMALTRIEHGAVTINVGRGQLISADNYRSERVG